MTMIPDERIPQAIGRYQVLKVLGAGAMGNVLLAEDPRIKRKVAIKVVRLESLRTQKDQEEHLARFQREAEVSGLLNHPGIVTIYDVGEEAGIGPFMAMEYVQGQTLDALIKSGVQVPLAQKLVLAGSIAEALDHAHQLGVIHRDVKPGNVMVTEDGRAKLMDFGIAKREDAGLTQTGTFLGTPSYAAPEQIREGTVTARSDQFSFAVMVFELLSGKLPFPGSSINTILYRIVNEPPSDPVPPVEGILPEAWHRIFLRALDKEPEGRFESCGAFLQELRAAAGMPGAAGSAPPSPLPAPGSAPADGDPSATRAAGPIPPLSPDLSTRVTPLLKVGSGYDETLSGELGEPAARRSPWPWVAALLVAGATTGFVLWSRRGGTLVLLKTSPDQASVQLNGRTLDQRTPLQQALKPGDHLRFEARGFQPKELDFDGTGAWPAQVALDPVLSPVTLHTEPEGAKVVLDGKSLDGATPLQVTWNQGQPHQLTFSLGASTLPKDFAVGEVPAGVYTLQAPAVAAAASSGNGTLRLAGAFPVHLRVDGEDKGELAPGQTLELPPGDHRVEWSNPKVFCAAGRTLSVVAGQETRLAIPGLGSLTVNTHPGVGDVLVDGRPAGIQSDGSSVKVAEGRHTVTVRSLGGKTATRTLEVRGDTPVDLPL
ncbi:MAG TPA: serine/threonine-protein kinase [Holophagaceae bacterium]|nr:serine/threonine-protein kinase [Holophagaceae bacterium]